MNALQILYQRTYDELIETVRKAEGKHEVCFIKIIEARP